MNTSLPYIRKQSDLLTEFKAKIGLTAANPRWTTDQFYLGMREGVQQWDTLVRVPFWYTIVGGFVAGTYEYTMPSYIRPPITPQVKRFIPYDDWGVQTTTYTWQNVPGHLEPDSAGTGQVLRLHAAPRTLEGRIGFYAPNSLIPYSATLPVTSAASTSSTATSMIISTAIEVSDVGIVDCEGEKIAYFGVTRGTSTTTLTGLVRGLYGTTAATHAGASTVAWCIAADDQSLYNQLYDYVAYTLHRLSISDGGTHETASHQQMMLFHQGNAMNFWAGYEPKRDEPKMVLGARKFVLR